MCLCWAAADAVDLAVQYGKIITKLGYDARFQDFKVQNIVGSTDVKFPIRLEGLAYGHAIFASVSSSSGLVRALLMRLLSGWSCFCWHYAHLRISTKV